MSGYEPIIIAAVIAAAGTATTAYVASESAKEQGKQAQYDAEFNAEMQEQNAGIAREQAGAEEAQVRRRTRLLMSRQRAAVAESGQSLTGSALDVYQQSAAEAELDALNVRYRGELEARGLLSDANLQRQQGATARRFANSEAKGIKVGGAINTGAALLGGYSNYRQARYYRTGG